MFKTLSTGKSCVGIIPEEITDAMNEGDGYRSFEQRIYVLGLYLFIGAYIVGRASWKT